MTKQYTKTQDGKLRIVQTIETAEEKEQSELEIDISALESVRASHVAEIAKLDVQIAEKRKDLAEAVKLDSKR